MGGMCGKGGWRDRKEALYVSPRKRQHTLELDGVPLLNSSLVAGLFFSIARDD
jgi:hypothetical protein